MNVRKMNFNLNNDNLLEEYTNFLNKAFTKAFWNGDLYNGERIYWSDAKNAKKQIEEFNKTGIYIWGFSNNPMYIGKAEKQTLAKRFGRYAYGNKAQYLITTNYWEHLRNGGKKKEVEELIEEYKLSHKYHKTRCRQAKLFGEKMTENAWFLFIPLSSNVIHDLEYELIAVGNEYNTKNQFDELLNKVKKGVKKKYINESTDEINIDKIEKKYFNKIDEFLRKTYSDFHSEVFFEEFDINFDSNTDIAIRKRGINPMKKEYIENKIIKESI